MEPIELKTVRPFIFERVWLKDPGERDFDHGDSEKQSERMLTGIVQKMLVDTERKQAGEKRDIKTCVYIVSYGWFKGIVEYFFDVQFMRSDNQIV